MEYLIIVGIIIAGVPILACTLMHLPRIKAYKEVYRSLKKEDFHIYEGVWGNLAVNKSATIIYFPDGDIKLRDDLYMFNSLTLTYVSPVSAYWYIKFKKFFNKIKENNEKP